MTKRKPIESYSDMLSLLDTAIKHEGVKIPYPSARKAVAARHRLYRARTVYFDQTSNPRYNDLYIQLVYPDGTQQGPGVLTQPESPCNLLIKLHSKRELPTIETLDGQPISAVPTSLDEDEMAAAAALLRDKLLG